MNQLAPWSVVGLQWHNTRLPSRFSPEEARSAESTGLGFGEL